MSAVSLERHCSGVELSSGGRDISSDTPDNSCEERHYNIMYTVHDDQLAMYMYVLHVHVHVHVYTTVPVLKGRLPSVLQYMYMRQLIFFGKKRVVSGVVVLCCVVLCCLVCCLIHCSSRTLLPIQCMYIQIC